MVYIASTQQLKELVQLIIYMFNRKLCSTSCHVFLLAGLLQPLKKPLPFPKRQSLA
jgi:hypothetical protein